MTTRAPTPRDLPDLDPASARGLIEDLIYEHLIDLVDWERARSLADIVRGYFVASLEEPPSAGSAERKAERLANELIAAAWKRLAEDERVFMESELSWEGNEDDCILCRELAARAGTRARS